MILYLIDRTDSVDYDEYDAFVVAALNPSEARKLAVAKCTFGPEKSSFRSARHSTCKVIGTSGLQAGIVLGSFNAG